jgi:hypothetical protein
MHRTGLRSHTSAVSLPELRRLPPVSVPLDLSLSDDEIHTLTEAMVLATSGSMKRSEWRSQLQQRLSQEGTLEARG